VVLLGGHRPGHERVAAVGADDHPDVLGDGGAVAAVAADARPPAVDDDVGDGEPLPDLGAGLGGGVTSSLTSTVRRGP